MIWIFYTTLLGFIFINSTANPVKNVLSLINRDGAERRLLDENLPEDTFVNISNYLFKNGYPFEKHHFTTEDGYILEMHRIPNTKANVAKNQTIPRILFVPPLMCSSIDWVSNGPNGSLALLSFDLGYDVWLLNHRGTRYSMSHIIYNNTEEAFWNFSFHEKGYYDLAASVDYVLNYTESKKLTMVSYSEGTAAAMALATTRLEYNEKIELMVLLSPIGYMGGVSSIVPVLTATFLPILQEFTKAIHLYGVPYNEEVSKLIISVCAYNDDMKKTCSILLGLFLGYDPEQIDLNHLIVMMSDKPSGVAMKQFYHMAQEIVSESFRQYDYGTEENLVRYGTTEPPAYNLNKLTAPMALYYAKNDPNSPIANVEKLLNQLPNVVDSYLVEYEQFNHLDFIAAKDINTLLYDRVLAVMNKIINK
ncbi:hypothetical protein ABEB36_007614 [Hypothenemus hampei]|uniref:Lipase n=1 Tax=Hypothenemus hampei TaxID=57062 RepID=A0ABD1EV73_HYPHA